MSKELGVEKKELVKKRISLCENERKEIDRDAKMNYFEKNLKKVKVTSKVEMN